ncbi:MAG: response regulator [Treponemataceae bacterium]|nr:response regulator [Treponemataceae bacterium]
MRIIIVDDSAVIRAMLEQNLQKEADIEIVASVSNGRKAIDSAKTLKPDLVILDTDMPELDGISATRILAKELWIPVLIFSEDSFKEEEAKKAGAVSFVKKPDLSSMNSAFFEPFIAEIRRASNHVVIGFDKTKITKTAKHQDEEHISSNPYQILCIGASTGGPTAVQKVISGLGRDFPLPVLYVQHIEIGADVKMVEWFNSTCSNITVKLAEDGETAKAGVVYMAPADKHLVIDYVRSSGEPVIALTDDVPVRFLRPAVDKLFFSAAEHYGESCIATLLTGMGRDGADGCKAIKDAGGFTIVEDESTCAVFGMPAAAIEVGGASVVRPRGEISQIILHSLEG